ncbi:hypothetical protein BCR43DRAFT_490000 [Syncephalastrum racemosum]|uniref:Uncharacterized protein n=1 Tax=Syncephalastrum racemosum TaxID=13706 RepID=A0A1X2HF95_SYNRA|nr:hypothetical protein BCR43DRAFT_490000 [Syncephalastrum racemosum]
MWRKIMHVHSPKDTMTLYWRNIALHCHVCSKIIRDVSVFALYPMLKCRLLIHGVHVLQQ